MDYMALSAAEWQQEYDKVSAEYDGWKAKGLKLNMARGKPSKQHCKNRTKLHGRLFCNCTLNYIVL